MKLFEIDKVSSIAIWFIYKGKKYTCYPWHTTDGEVTFFEFDPLKSPAELEKSADIPAGVKMCVLAQALK